MDRAGQTRLAGWQSLVMACLNPRRGETELAVAGVFDPIMAAAGIVLSNASAVANSYWLTGTIRG